MQIIKEKTEFGTNIILDDNDKYLMISFRGNLDLYWSIHYKNLDEKDNTIAKYFIITKENYHLYRLFENLFNDIDNINLYDEAVFIPSYLETEEEIEEYLEEQRRQKEEAKDSYKLYNCSNYNELFDEKSRTITWYSDETAHEVANILKIKQEKNIFILEFYIQPYIEGYDEDFHSASHIPIRFRNSGSSYEPFNFIFMRMYNEMKNIDDVNDYGHQMHIEEYMLRKFKKQTNHKRLT